MPQENTIQTPFILTSRPGILRDSTVVDGDYYSDGQWVRFYRGKPKKIGGFRSISLDFTGPIRGVHVFPKQSFVVTHSFSTSKVEAVLIDVNGLGAAIYDRTPVGFTTNSDYSWQIVTFFDSAGSDKSVIIAHPGANLSHIDNNLTTPVYYGDVTANTALIPLGQSVDGGVVAIPPYLVLYGSNGLVKNSSVNEITNFTTGDSDENNVGASKIVKGLPIRGSGQSPSAMLWSLDSVIRMSFVQGARSPFRFDFLSNQTSILSSNGVIEMDGVYYWAGVDRFYQCSGTVQELPNQINLNFFFDNIQVAKRQKVWATKVPRFGEIWWFFPMNDATECNHAVVYNVRERTWYDVEIGRSVGYYPQVFKFPLWADTVPQTTGKYAIYQHEFGVNQIVGDVETAIPSSFTTRDLGLPTGGTGSEAIQGLDQWSRIRRVEPDFVQSGPMTVEILTREYAKSPDVSAAMATFDEDTEKLDFRVQGRFYRMKFTSNTYGGDYQLGSTIVDIAPGDKRQ